MRARMLWLCLACYAAAGAELLIGAPGLLTGGGPDAVREALGAVWLPTLIGLPLVWLVSARGHRAEMDARVGRALTGHAVGIETVLLLACLVGHLVGSVALAALFGLFQDGLLALATPVARVFFLLIVPVLLTDHAGLTLRAGTPAMSTLAMRVTEPWRWSGLAPVLLCLGALALLSPGHLAPHHGGLVFGAIVALVAIAVPEEVFFRALLQTRLERLFGRWPGILLGALVSGLTFALLGDRSEIAAPGGVPWVPGVGFAVISHGVIAVLYGYVWACYRNIWLNILLRAGVVALLAAPGVRLFEFG